MSIIKELNVSGCEPYEIYSIYYYLYFKCGDLKSMKYIQLLIY